MITFFSPENKYSKFVRKLNKTYNANDKSTAASLIFCKAYNYLLSKKRYDLLSDLIMTHLPKMTDKAILYNKITIEKVNQACSALELAGFNANVIALYDFFNQKESAVEFFAKKSNVDDLIIYIT